MKASAPVQRRRLLTLRETAEFLSVSERTARRLIDERGLPGYRLGQKGTAIRVDEGELEAWLRRDVSDDGSLQGQLRADANPAERDGTSGRREAVEPTRLAEER